MKQKPSKQEVIEALWYKGNLSWMLDPNQKSLYSLFHDSKFKVQTWLLARRSGKSFCLCILAIEECIKKPNSIIKFLSPTRLQVRNNLRPLIRQVLETCPEDLKPEFKAKDDIYYFKNGSEIQLAGSDSGHAEKLRGGNSNIAIIDEAGDVNDLDNIIKSILLPTTLTTKGKIIIAGTPPKESDHDFLKFIEEAELRGSLIKKTVYDNPRVTKEDLDEIIVELGGTTTESFKREMLCEIVKDNNTSVIPEFTQEIEKEIVREWPRPPFFDSYVSMDLGFKDLTAIVFGYYDFRADKVIIEDELCLDFTENEMDVKKLTSLIQKKEKDLWYNVLTNEQKKPYLRISDINYIVTKEISIASAGDVNFIIPKKDDNDAAINNLRNLIGSKKVIIHPRCVTLIRHLKNVKWAKTAQRKFARSPDNGHYDFVDAIKYMVRTIQFSKNPYPSHYDMNLKDLHVQKPNNFYKNTTLDTYRIIFGRKR